MYRTQEIWVEKSPLTHTVMISTPFPQPFTTGWGIKALISSTVCTPQLREFQRGMHTTVKGIPESLV